MSNVITRNAAFIAKVACAVAVGGILVGYNGWASRAVAADEAVQQQINEAQRNTSARGAYATDGTFTGTAQGYGGPVTCSVTIENGYITDVEVTDAPNEDAEYLDQAIVLTQDVVDAQTSGVDTVSGATLSSAGILNAVTQALQQSIDGAGTTDGGSAASDGVAVTADAADVVEQSGE